MRDVIKSIRGLNRSLKRLKNARDKAKIHFEICSYAIRIADHEKIRKHALASLKIGKELKDKHIITRAKNFLGRSYELRGEHEKAFECHSKALQMARQIKYEDEIAASYDGLGLVFWHKGEWDKAIEQFQKGLKTKKRSEDEYWIAIFYNNLGLVHWERGDWDEAIGYHKLSIELREKIDDIYGLSVSYLNLGLVYGDKGDWEKAIEYYYRALVEKEKTGDKIGIALCYNNIGEIYLKRGKIAKAAEFFKNSVKVGEEAESDWVIAEALGNLGEVYFLEGNVEMACSLYEKDIKLSERMEDKEELAEVLRRIADLSLAQGKSEIAEECLNKVILLAEESGTRKEIGNVRRSLGILSLAKGMEEKAKEFFESSVELLEDIEATYELGKTQLEFGKFFNQIGKPGRAIDHLRIARDTFQKLGAARELELSISLLEDLEIKRLHGKELRFAVLQDLNRIVSKATSPHELEQQIMRYFTQSLSFDGCAILLKQREPAYFGKIDRGEALTAYNEGKLVLSPYLFIPLKEGGIYLKGKVVPFSEQDKEFISSLADCISLGFKKLALEEELSKLKSIEISEKQKRYTFGEIVGESASMQQICNLISKISDTKANVLIRGETGTGKELVARTIHSLSRRKDNPFIVINCAAIPEALLESELFGIEKGTATEVTQRIGKFEQANRGTIFLDEIGDMSPATQAKVLRVIQEKEFERVGGRKTLKVDIRIITATHRDLGKAIKTGEFREDLYYRLNVVNIFIPPLRERKEDIPLLVGHFIAKYNPEYNKKIKGVTSRVMDRFLSYNWPGNVRELENFIERAIILCKGDTITLGDLPPILYGIEKGVPTTVANLREAKRLAKEKAVEAIERDFILEALRKTSGNVTRAAKEIGIARRQLYRLMKKHDIKREAI